MTLLGGKRRSRSVNLAVPIGFQPMPDPVRFTFLVVWRRAGAVEAHARQGTICFQNSGGNPPASLSNWPTRRDSNARPPAPETGDLSTDLRVADFAVPIEIIQPALMQVVRREFPLDRHQLARRGLDRPTDRPPVLPVLCTVARPARRNDVFPCRLAAVAPRDDVVEGQVVGSELLPAILAAEAVAQEDYSATIWVRTARQSG